MRKVLFILGEFADSDIDWMAAYGVRESHQPGALLIEEGRPIGSLYILLRGMLAVDIAGLGEVARLSAGEVVGEMSLVDSRPPSATVKVVEPSILLRIGRDRLLAQLAADTGFAARFYRAIAVFLSDRLRGTVKRMGYGAAQTLDEGTELEDELEPDVLDKVHLAGARFEHMLRRLLG